MTFRWLPLALATIGALWASDDSGISGSWTGESLCTGVRSACKDEHVIWTLTAPDAKGRVSCSADKVVDGQRINMGTGELQYDKEASTLTQKIPLGVWKLTIRKDIIEATLILNDGAVARNMKLKKDPS